MIHKARNSYECVENLAADFIEGTTASLVVSYFLGFSLRNLGVSLRLCGAVFAKDFTAERQRDAEVAQRKTKLGPYWQAWTLNVWRSNGGRHFRILKVNGR